MMKFFLFLFTLLTSLSVWAGGLCLNSSEYNKSRSLFERGDLLYFHGSGAASERLCTDQRTKFFSRCIDAEINFENKSKYKICDQTDTKTKEFIQNTRERCGQLTYEKNFADCAGEPYSFPTCQQFTGFVDGNEKNKCLLKDISPGVGVLEPMSAEMTRKERHQQVLFSLRDNLVQKFEKGLEPISAFRKCLQAKYKEAELKSVKINDQEVQCQKIVDALMAKVIMKLPLLRQHQILGNTPAMVNGVQEILPFQRRFERMYPDADFDDAKLRDLGTSVSLEPVPLPIGGGPDPTLNELIDASQIRKSQFKYRDQQFFEAYRNKEPFRRCIVRMGREEDAELGFVSIVKNHTRAMKCGKVHVRDESQVVGSINVAQDELNMTDAGPREAYRAMLSYRSKIVLDHKKAVKAMVEEEPFLGYLNLTTDDLPLEKDKEEVQENKRKKIYESLLRSFALMEHQSTGELEKVKAESNLKELRAIMMENPSLVEQSIRNQPNLDKRTCDTLESLYQVQKISKRNSNALRITASIIGGVSCPFTWGAGCLLAAAAQIPHVSKLNRQKNLALGKFFSGQGDLEEYIALEKKHSHSKFLLGTELVGIPVLGPGKLFLKSFQEAALVSRTVKNGSRKVSEALFDHVPRYTFGKDVSTALKASRSQGNVEFFTLHGMASSHSAIRVGDTVYHTGQGFGKSIGSSAPKGVKGDFVAEPFETFLTREMKNNNTLEGLTIRVPDEELAFIRAKAEALEASGQAYSLFKSNCSQTVCDIVTHKGVRTVDVDRTFDPLLLRERLNNSLGDRAIGQNVYGNEARLGNSSRRRYLMASSAYALGLTYGDKFTGFYPE